MSKFTVNINRTVTDGKEMHIALWFPVMYWDLAAKSFNAQQQEIDMIKSWMGGYTMFMVYHGEMDVESQGFVSESEKAMRSKISMEFNGKTYKPVPTSDLPEELQAFVGAFKPMMTQMFGTMGPGMNAYFFDVRDSMGDSEIDPYKNTDFKILFDKKVMNFDLPLPSLYPDKPCELDGEMYPSNYNYCPIHGNKLN